MELVDIDALSLIPGDIRIGGGKWRWPWICISTKRITVNTSWGIAKRTHVMWLDDNGHVITREYDDSATFTVRRMTC